MTETNKAVSAVKEAMASKDVTAAKTKMSPLELMLTSASAKERFGAVLKEKAAGFVSSLITAYNTNPALQECDAASIMSSAMVAATLDLPINQSLGFAYIVPYKGKAQFQIGWKGLVQLAIRSGQYTRLEVTPVFKGQIKRRNILTGDFELHDGEPESDEIIGYAAYTRMCNGFEKVCFMTKFQITEHAKKYSQSYKSGRHSVWNDDFDSMACKTVVKALLSKWGALSVEMQKAITFDQAAVDPHGNPVYIDNGEVMAEVAEQK